MRVAMLTREWPPDVYGGAGVHVVELVEHLGEFADIDVHCFGSDRADAIAQPIPEYLSHANPAVQTMGVDLGMVASVDPTTDIVHSHTWYTNLAGQLTSLLVDIPHVITAHSLEPLRPWKREQLGDGYRISSWIEESTYLAADAIIAVSDGMRADICAAYPQVDPARVHVVHNGIDTDAYQPTDADSALSHYGIDRNRPYALFVGRITHQKGLIHLLRAAVDFDDDAVLVLCASSPDTPDIADQIGVAIDDLRTRRGEDSVIWIDEPVDKPSLIQLLSHARVFTCPSIYEPLGIVNLEAMACGTAVVASAVGGIPEVVQSGVTGTLVPFDPEDVATFERAFATAVNQLMGDEAMAKTLGSQGRERAIQDFSWTAIAEQTMHVYRWAQAHRAGRT